MNTVLLGKRARGNFDKNIIWVRFGENIEWTQRKRVPNEH